MPRKLVFILDHGMNLQAITSARLTRLMAIFVLFPERKVLD